MNTTIEQKPSTSELPEQKFEEDELIEERLRTKIDDLGHDLVVYAEIPRPDNLKVVLEDYSQPKKLHLDLAAEFVKQKESITEMEFSLKNGKDFVFDIENYSVHVPIEALNDPREVFTLLHELGHVKDFNSNIERRCECIERGMFNSRYLRGETKEGEIFDHLFSVLKQERQAWANAIKMARKLKKEREIDLFENFENADDFMSWLRERGLLSYEAELELHGIPAFTNKNFNKQWERKREETIAAVGKESYRDFEVND